MVNIVLALEWQINPGEKVVVGVRPVLLRRFEQSIFRFDHGVIRPANVHTLIQNRKARPLRVQLRQDLYFLVDVNVYVVPHIVQTVNQCLEQPEFVVCQDEVGVFHASLDLDNY